MNFWGLFDQFELQVPNRRAKDGLVDAIAASKKATLPELLPGLTRDSLKALCQRLGLDDSGRDKASLIDRLVSAKVTRADSAPPPSKKNGRQSKPPAQVSIEVEPGELLTREKLEGYLWSAADILRGFHRFE